MKKIDREIKACQDLLAHYQGKTRIYGCALCGLALACHRCVWVRFEKMDCAKFTKKLHLKYGANVYRNDIYASERWRKTRIKMLKRWIRLLKKEKAGK